MVEMMRRVKLTAPKKAMVEEVTKPQAGPGEVLMKVAYCGICGSDLHASVGKHPFVPLPATPGHEFAGWVEEVGPRVKGFRRGDRVTSEPNLVCGECYNCRIGRYNICENLRVIGCQGEGAMADYILLPADKTVPIPDSLSLKYASLVEPVAVGIHAVHKADDLFGKNIVIIGCGMIGLAVLAATLQCGSKHIWITDFVNERLRLAKEMGGDSVINAKEDIAKVIKREVGLEGIDVAFECVGTESALRSSMDAIRKGGRVIVMGIYGDEAKIRGADLQDREMELIGSLMYTMRDIEEAIKLLTDKKVPADKIIGKIFPLEQADEAFEFARTHREKIRITFEINKE